MGNRTIQSKNNILGGKMPEKKLAKKEEKFKLLDDALKTGLAKLAQAYRLINKGSLESNELAMLELELADKEAHLIARIAEMKAATL